MSEWQPIETAPKDGSDILAFGKGHGRNLWAYSINDPAKEMQEVIAYKTGHCVCSIGFRPTHWQPLPEPPND